MECKFKYDGEHFNISARFNRYIVECKWGIGNMGLDMVSDLIDT